MKTALSFIRLLLATGSWSCEKEFKHREKWLSFLGAYGGKKEFKEKGKYRP